MSVSFSALTHEYYYYSNGQTDKTCPFVFHLMRFHTLKIGKFNLCSAISDIALTNICLLSFKNYSILQGCRDIQDQSSMCFFLWWIRPFIADVWILSASSGFDSKAILLAARI